MQFDLIFIKFSKMSKLQIFISWQSKWAYPIEAFPFPEQNKMMIVLELEDRRHKMHYV